MGTTHRVSSSKATSLEDAPKQVRNESRVSGEETTNAEGACADMHVGMDIGIDSDATVDDDYLVADKGCYETVLEDVNKEQVVETNTKLGETAATSNVEEMVQQDVSAATTDEVYTAEEKEKRRAHGERMQAFIDSDEVLQARIKKLYTDETVNADQKVQKLADLINERYEELSLKGLITSIQQRQSQKRKRNPTGRLGMGVMKKYIQHQGMYKASRLSGMTYEQVEILYYQIKKYVESFTKPMGTEETPSKKQKIIEDKPAEKKNDSQRKEDSSSHDQMMLIVPETTLYIDPIQARHPIMDSGIYLDRFGKSWKIIRAGGGATVYKDLRI